MEEILNAILIHLMVSKLDTEAINKYNEAQDLKEFPSWEKCYSILSRRCQFLETKIRANETPAKQLPTNYRANQVTKRATLVNTNISCYLCNSSEHFIGYCPTFLSLSVGKRIEAAKHAALCLNCLRKGHFSSKCTSKSRCRSCGAMHHTTIHFDSAPKSSATGGLNAAAPTFQAADSIVQATPVTLVNFTTKRAFIPTALILIRDCTGSFHPIRALLDSCSEINFITEEAAKRLKLKWQHKTQEVSGIADVRTKISKFVNATIRSRINTFEWTASFAVTSKISAKMPGDIVSVHNWKLPEDIDLADPGFIKPQ